MSDVLSSVTVSDWNSSTGKSDESTQIKVKV